MIETISAPSISTSLVMTLDPADARQAGWRRPLIEYLETGHLPANSTEARLIVRRSWRYAVSGTTLYRQSATHPWLKCISEEEGDHCLKEIHEGVCGSHQGAKTLARKARLQGLYWPTMEEDASTLVRKCESCQIHANTYRAPGSEFRGILTPWPFVQWGIDILGPFPPASGQRRWVLLAIDHFTKWAEARAVTQVTSAKTIDFLRDQVLERFGIPHSFLTDNGRQFDCAEFQEFCDRWGIKRRFTSVAHPQTNGLTEVTNRTLLNGLKTRLHREGRTWPDHLSAVLWSYRTTPHSATGKTPFFLTYGSESMPPAEITLRSPRVEEFDENRNNEALTDAHDSLEEERLNTLLTITRYKQKVAQYYNQRVRARKFTVGDLVLRNAAASQSRLAKTKLGQNWEGPYQVIEDLANGAYRLAHLSGEPLNNTWNVQTLRRFYQ